MREVEILHLATYGLTRAEIADKLWMSPDTVKTHMTRIFVVLGARNLVHAICLALRHGDLAWDDHTRRIVPMYKDNPAHSE